MGMDLAEQEKVKVTLPGQPGYRGAWDADRSTVEASESQVRDSAIEGATADELTEAIDSMTRKLEADPQNVTLREAAAQAHARLTELLKRNTH